MPLYKASDRYEYLTRPCQEMVRLGNHFYTNQWGMRSNEVDSVKTCILGLGDSVLNGGVQTSNEELATSLVSDHLNVQMLNISAGSWGPDNAAAYLKDRGLFQCKAMFLLVSSHDAHDNMDFKPVVGKHVSYPDKQYSLAWIEVIDRYLIPRLPIPRALDPDAQVLVSSGIKKEGVVFNPGFDQLREMCQQAQIPLVVFLHPEKVELTAQSYNEQGQEIIQWCTDHQIPLVALMDKGFTESDYRDNIHINPEGQRKLATIFENQIIKLHLEK